MVKIFFYINSIDPFIYCNLESQKQTKCSQSSRKISLTCYTSITGKWSFFPVVHPKKPTMEPENRPCQKESSLPTINFLVRTVSFRGVYLGIRVDTWWIDKNSETWQRAKYPAKNSIQNVPFGQKRLQPEVVMKIGGPKFQWDTIPKSVYICVE